MSLLNSIKSRIKRRILIPVCQNLGLEKNKYFAVLLRLSLRVLPFSYASRIRLLEEFLERPICTVDGVAEETDKRKTLPLEFDAVSSLPVQLIAFYLPQFHAIAENNEWWGEGFTEWTNVRSATPQFADHDQPVCPGELGYYNLDDVGVMRQQADLARQYGVQGFCFYFYWFAGKRLLEKPLLQFLENKDIDQNFCLCWANENWTRCWDGLESEVLIAQEHSSEDDLNFIEYVSRYFKDHRYIRVSGKPLVLVYRPGLLPDPAKTVELWRGWCRENDIGEIFLAYTQSFETVDPTEYGFDGAVEFPPNNSSPPLVTESIADLNDDFAGHIYDWSVFPERSENYDRPAYTLFRGVCPSWDNTARRKNKGTIFVNNSPAEYQRWLQNAACDTVDRFPEQDKRLVFVNAWNEWAERACLEPDRLYGHAFLEATRRGQLNSFRKLKGRRILLVAHDAHPHGAQYLILNMAKTLRESMGFAVDILLLGAGELIHEYEKYANVHDISELDPHGEEVATLLTALHRHGVTSAIANTTVSGVVVPLLKRCGFTVVSLIHELPQLIRDYGLQEQVKNISDFADQVVFAATPVRNGFESFCELDKRKAVIRPQGLYKKNKLQTLEQKEEARCSLGKRFKVSPDVIIVLGVGYADYRKGIDLFVQAGIELLRQGRKVFFLWLGNVDGAIQAEISKMLGDSGYASHFGFPGLDYETDVYYAGADIYALTSREDPFPSVVLEALDARTPVVAFADSGGAAELLKRGGGVLVDEMTSSSFATAVVDLVDSPNKRQRLGEEGKCIIDAEFSFRHYLFELLDMLDFDLPRVSVVVPNYNYEQYLKERLFSIIRQDYPVYEIIVLDDASSDNSVDLIVETLASQLIDFRIIVNKENSGSVFKQWQKGVELARGTHVWIAEADDSCGDDFLDEVMAGFSSSEVVLSYCESKQIDESGHVLANNYWDYVADIGKNRWFSAFTRDGHEEVTEALCVKNTIPNVSGVVFDKSNLLSVLAKNIDQICSYRIAGDWLVYALILDNGKISFSPMPLNYHRRQQKGVTISSFDEGQLAEIKKMQSFIAVRFSVPKEKAVIAVDYIELLKKQFGLVCNHGG